MILDQMDRKKSIGIQCKKETIVKKSDIQYIIYWYLNQKKRCQNETKISAISPLLDDLLNLI